MFTEYFKKFKKPVVKSPTEDLDAEFERIKKLYSQLGNSDIYMILSEYFLAKLEINRDEMEKVDLSSSKGILDFTTLKAENKVMRGFIEDIESMKLHAEMDLQSKKS